MLSGENVKFADIQTLLLPRFLAREKFEQLITRPTHIKGGDPTIDCIFCETYVGKIFAIFHDKSAFSGNCTVYLINFLRSH